MTLTAKELNNKVNQKIAIHKEIEFARCINYINTSLERIDKSFSISVEVRGCDGKQSKEICKTLKAYYSSLGYGCNFGKVEYCSRYVFSIDWEDTFINKVIDFKNRIINKFNKKFSPKRFFILCLTMVITFVIVITCLLKYGPTANHFNCTRNKR